MQQATVNLLADMGAQPLTRQANLVAATKSTDTTGPAVTMTAPAAGSDRAGPHAGDRHRDRGGGRRRPAGPAWRSPRTAAPTWAAATGQGNWSYTWTPSAQGPAQIKVRASDDSLNIGRSPPGA